MWPNHNARDRRGSARWRNCEGLWLSSWRHLLEGRGRSVITKEYGLNQLKGNVTRPTRSGSHLSSLRWRTSPWRSRRIWSSRRPGRTCSLSPPCANTRLLWNPWDRPWHENDQVPIRKSVVEGISLLVAARSEDINRKCARGLQCGDDLLPATGGVAVGDKPGSSGCVVYRVLSNVLLAEFLNLQFDFIRRENFSSNDFPVGDGNVRVQPIGHGPVEEVVPLRSTTNDLCWFSQKWRRWVDGFIEWNTSQNWSAVWLYSRLKSERVGGRLHHEHDVPLSRRPPPGQIVLPEGPLVEEDGIKLVDAFLSKVGPEK